MAFVFVTLGAGSVMLSETWVTVGLVVVIVEAFLTIGALDVVVAS